MITIDQLLESVDLDFEPRFVTKEKNGDIEIWSEKPNYKEPYWYASSPFDVVDNVKKIKVSEFENKKPQECIYEVPRKTSGKIELLKETAERVMLWKINELVDAVNALIESNNIH